MKIWIAFLLLCHAAFAGVPGNAVVCCSIEMSDHGELYSGTVLRADNGEYVILTAKHCTWDREKLPVRVRFKNNHIASASFLAQGEGTEGPALLKLHPSYRGEYPTATIAAGNPFAEREPIRVCVLGYPNGVSDLKCAKGWYRRSSVYETDGRTATYFNESGPITWHGYSGGPVLNAAGEIVGVVSGGGGTVDGQRRPDERMPGKSFYVKHTDIVKLCSQHGITVALPKRTAPTKPIPKHEHVPEPTAEPVQLAEAPHCGNGWGAGIGVGGYGPGGSGGIGIGIGGQQNRPPRWTYPWHGKSPDGRPFLVRFISPNCGECLHQEREFSKATEAGKEIRRRYHYWQIDVTKASAYWSYICHLDGHDGSTPYFRDTLQHSQVGYESGTQEEFLARFTGDRDKPEPPAKPAEPTPIPQVPTPEPDPQPQVDVDELKRELKAELRALLVDIDIRGTSGRDGQPGRNGKDGATGPRGANGAQGLRGEPGPPGKDGRHGIDGKSADPHEIAKLNEQIAGLYHEIQNLKHQLSQATRPEDVAEFDAIRAEFYQKIAELKTIETPVRVRRADQSVYSEEKVKLFSGDAINLDLEGISLDELKKLLSKGK